MAQPALLEAEMAPFFTTKAPFQFPVNFREGFVKYWPIVSLILLLLSLPAILIFLGIGAFMVPASYMAGVGGGVGYTVSMILTTVSLVLGVLALPGLFNRKRGGWVLSYYAQLVSIVAGVLTINILGIIFGLLFLMLLFQVREYYT